MLLESDLMAVATCDRSHCIGCERGPARFIVENGSHGGNESVNIAWRHLHSYVSRAHEITCAWSFRRHDGYPLGDRFLDDARLTLPPACVKKDVKSRIERSDVSPKTGERGSLANAALAKEALDLCSVGTIAYEYRLGTRFYGE
jgi:hypothetical protein